MSSRVCYIEREDRGAVLRRMRIVGAKTDDTWIAPPGMFDRQTFLAAASWVGDRLNGRLKGRTLDRLCLDVDGALCTWITAASTDPKLVRAVIEQESVPETDDPFADPGLGGAGRFPDLPGEVDFETLPEGRPETEGPARTPVLAVPDIAARVFMDALDESGVQVGSCLTLWQAMIKAWTDASSPAGGRVVAETSPVVAVVLCTPGDRVVWAWGRGGAPIAAGAFRIRPFSPPPERALEGPSPHTPMVRPDHSIGGRLSTEWLAWSAQIGKAPVRVVWVGPVGEGMGGAEIASALRRAAPGASVDVVDDPDPVGLTLRRLAERLDAGEERPAPADHIEALSNRPGRVHRAMYRWLAILLLAASAAMGALAWDFWQQRGRSVEALAAVRADQRALLEAEAPDLADDRLALLHLRERVSQARGPATVEIPPPKPVVQELETLAFVLGNPDYELIEIDISSLSATFRVRVDDTMAFEQLQQSLFGIGGSNIVWTPLNPRQMGGRIEVSASGTWSQEDRSPGGDN